MVKKYVYDKGQSKVITKMPKNEEKYNFTFMTACLIFHCLRFYKSLIAIKLYLLPEYKQDILILLFSQVNYPMLEVL